MVDVLVLLVEPVTPPLEPELLPLPAVPLEPIELVPLLLVSPLAVPLPVVPPLVLPAAPAVLPGLVEPEPMALPEGLDGLDGLVVLDELVEPVPPDEPAVPAPSRWSQAPSERAASTATQAAAL